MATSTERKKEWPEPRGVGVWHLGLRSHRRCALLTVLCSRWGLCTEMLINYQAQNNPQAWHLITKSIWVSWLTPEVSVFIETGLSESPLALTELRPFFCLHIKNKKKTCFCSETKKKKKKHQTNLDLVSHVELSNKKYRGVLLRCFQQGYWQR